MSTKYISLPPPYYAQGFIKLLPGGDRAPELRYFQYRPNESEGKCFQLLLLQQSQFTNRSCELLNISVGLRQKEIGELDEHDNLIILTEVIPVFAGKQTTPLAE